MIPRVGLRDGLKEHLTSWECTDSVGCNYNSRDDGYLEACNYDPDTIWWMMVVGIGMSLASVPGGHGLELDDLGELCGCQPV